MFVGAGGLCEGSKQAGFQILAANDFDADSAITFQLNNPTVPFIPGPIQNVDAAHVMEVANLQKGELSVLCGGPPCQAYSVYNHQRGMHDERSGLFREYLRIVEGLLPELVVMENVTGMTSVEKGRAVDEICGELGRLGYHVEYRVLKAEEYGVPQQRRRIFFIGSRINNRIEWPEPTHGDAHLPLLLGDMRPFVTVWDAIEICHHSCRKRDLTRLIICLDRFVNTNVRQDLIALAFMITFRRICKESTGRDSSSFLPAEAGEIYLNGFYRRA